MVPGLPGTLPQGERLLWQGSPSWWPLAHRTFRFGWLAVYFLVLAGWRIASTLADGGSVADAAFAGAVIGLGGLACGGILALLGWLNARATIYTITSRRVVIRHGVALPLSVNLPFKLIENVGLKTYSDGTGDIVLTLETRQRLAYLVLWPHARPWHIARVEPMLRAVPGAPAVARLLGEALAASHPPAETDGATTRSSTPEDAIA
jgi:hypothetical protein